MLKKFILILFIGFPLIIFSQSNNGKLSIKEIKKIEFEAGDYFGVGSYMQALPLYLKLLRDDPSLIEYKYNLGICYLHSPSEKYKALEYLQELAQIPDFTNEIHYYLGQSYHLNFQFEKAVVEYEKFMLNTKDKDPLKKDAIRRTEMCKNGLELMQNQMDVTIQNLGPIINSPYPDYSPSISTDERMLFFTTRREGTTGGNKDVDNFPFEDVFVSTRFEGDWTSPVPLPSIINTDGHDASVGLSPDGQQLLIYKDTEGDGNLYISDLTGAGFSSPKKLGSDINTKYWEPSASLTSDGSTIYFTSNRPGGYGERDIYKTQKLPTGEWGMAQNMGSKINTEYDEDAPFIHPDGVTLYFASKGHKSIGGFDIFKCTENAPNDWSVPENIGLPINTPDDDIYFVLSASGEHAYYVSAAIGGEGEKDVYMITMPKSEQKKIILFKGVVIYDGAHRPIPAKVVITNNETDEEHVSKVSSVDGQFLAVLQPGHYGISVEAEGYLFYSDNINIPTLSEFQEIFKIVDLQSVNIGQKIVLRNIFFDTGKSILRSESHIEIDKLYRLLKLNPTFDVEISGHTDAVGSEQDNRMLSESRAQAVVDDLIKRGVDKIRMHAKGYGESQPIETNDTQEGRQLNRRTEFKILKF